MPFGWFKKEKAQADPPGEDSGRYDGKPLLILLENYILDCIGVLDDQRQAVAIKIVQHVWGGDDDWKTTVRTQLHLDDAVDETFRGMWEKNRRVAIEKGLELSPEQFARMVVDENFAGLLS